jgi:hypothetical protein
MTMMSGTVGLRTDRSVVADDDAVVSLTLGSARDVDDVAGGEYVRLHFGTDLEVHHFIRLDFADVLLGSGVGLLGMADRSLGGTGLLDILIAELQCFVAVGFLRLLLKDDVRLNDIDRIKVASEG